MSQGGKGLKTSNGTELGVGKLRMSGMCTLHSELQLQIEAQKFRQLKFGLMGVSSALYYGSG
jgi:hypothetical protein